MAKCNLKDIIVFILKYFANYKKTKIAKHSLAIIVFFIDWKYTVKYDKRLTSIKWKQTKNKYICFDDVMTTVSKNKDLFKQEFTHYSTLKITTIELQNHSYEPRLTKKQKELMLYMLKSINSINRVFLKKLLQMSWIIKEKNFNNIDIIDIAYYAEEFRKEKQINT